MAVHSGEDADWDAIGRWAILPCQQSVASLSERYGPSGGFKRAMVRMSHRSLVFCPRYESYQVSSLTP